MLWKFRQFTLPGFDGVPVLAVYQFFVEEIKRQSISIRSRAIAFSFFLALFPALIFVFSLLPYLPLDEVRDQVQTLIKSVLPSGMLYGFINETITDLL